MVVNKRENVTLDFMDMNLNDESEEEKSGKKKKGKDKVQKLILSMFNKRINQIIKETLNDFSD